MPCLENDRAFVNLFKTISILFNLAYIFFVSLLSGAGRQWESSFLRAMACLTGSAGAMPLAPDPFARAAAMVYFHFAPPRLFLKIAKRKMHCNSFYGREVFFRNVSQLRKMIIPSLLASTRQ